MPDYEIRITKRALKDVRSLSPKMKIKLKSILKEVLSKTPFEGKQLVGDLKGNFSYRLNIHDRIIYSIDNDRTIVYIKRAKTHYDG